MNDKLPVVVLSNNNRSTIILLKGKNWTILLGLDNKKIVEIVITTRRGGTR